jgi:hypothetical protein
MSAVLINKRIYPFLWKTIVLSTNKRWQVRARGIIIIIISETRNGNRSQKRKKRQGGRSPRRCLRRLLAPRRRARRRPWRTSDAGPAPRTAGAAAGQGGTGRRRGRRRRRRAGARPWRAPWQQQLRDWVADGGRGESLPNAADTTMDGRVEFAATYNDGESVWCAYYRALSSYSPLPTPGSSCSSCPQVGAVTAATSRFYFFLQRTHQPDFARASTDRWI